jgi:hypothetical protein
MDVSEHTLGEPQVELAEMRTHREYKVCRDNHDPRGWPVRTNDDRELGKVSDLIIDQIALNARYLVCTFALDGRRILIPTGFARLDDRAKVVHLDFLTRQDISRLPTFHGLPLSSEQQLEVETALTGREQFEPESIIQRRTERRE